MTFYNLKLVYSSDLKDIRLEKVNKQAKLTQYFVMKSK
jgi:hypothetical protein